MSGQVDDFEDGTVQGWLTGSVNQNPPINIATGGPGGVDDNFLRLTSTGGFGPGSKMVVFNDDQWTGDYLGSGVSSVRMQVNNLGANDLVLRLILKDDAHGQSLTTLSPVNVPSGSGWTTVSFSLNSANLSGGNF